MSVSCNPTYSIFCAYPEHFMAILTQSLSVYYFFFFFFGLSYNTGVFVIIFSAEFHKHFWFVKIVILDVQNVKFINFRLAHVVCRYVNTCRLHCDASCNFDIIVWCFSMFYYYNISMLQPQNEQFDITKTHPVTGSVRNTSANGYLCEEWLLWGGSGTGCSCQKTWKKTFYYLCYKCRW